MFISFNPERFVELIADTAITQPTQWVVHGKGYSVSGIKINFDPSKFLEGVLRALSGSSFILDPETGILEIGEFRIRCWGD